MFALCVYMRVHVRVCLHVRVSVLISLYVFVRVFDHACARAHTGKTD